MQKFLNVPITKMTKRFLIEFVIENVKCFIKIKGGRIEYGTMQNVSQN